MRDGLLEVQRMGTSPFRSLISQIKNTLDKNEHVLGIFIDLSTALDTIDHNILLEHYGIRGRALSRLASYLQNRIQVVSVLAETSDPLSVIYGVPQGSCLGPLFFWSILMISVRFQMTPIFSFELLRTMLHMQKQMISLKKCLTTWHVTNFTLI